MDHFEIPNHSDAHAIHGRYCIFTDTTKMRRSEVSKLTDLINLETSDEMVSVLTLALDFLKYEPVQIDSYDLSNVLETTEPKKHSDKKYHYYSEEHQNIVLIPLNIKMLLHEFGEYSKFPSSISVKIIEMETKQLNQEMRNVNKYLDHLPIGSDVTFVEVDLSHVLSKDTIKTFSKELSSRHQGRFKREQSVIKEKLMEEEKERLEREGRIRENEVRKAELELLRDLNLSFPELAELYQSDMLESPVPQGNKTPTNPIPINTVKWGTNQIKTKKKEDFPSLGKTPPVKVELQGEWGKISQPTDKKKKK